MLGHVLRKTWRWSPLFLVLSVLLLLFAGEWQYASSVYPEGVQTIDDHLARFGTPEFITNVKRKSDPSIYFQLSGFPSSNTPRIALPSGRPAYIYDATGTLVDWCRDPGDTPQWHRTWRPISNPSSDVEPIIQQLQSNAA